VLACTSAWAESDSTRLSTGWEYFRAGDEFRSVGLIQESLTKYFQALRLAERASDEHLIAATCLQLGDLYEHYYRYAESIPYLKRAYALIQKSDSTNALAHVTNSIAWNYIKIKLYDSAKVYSIQSVSLYEQLPPKFAMDFCIALESLGEIYSFAGNYIESERTLARCLRLATQHQLPIAVGFTHYGIALNELHRSQAELAKTHIEACLPVAEKYASQELLADVYYLAYQVYRDVNDWTNAYRYLEKYSLLKDKIHSEDIEKKAAIINANFEIQKKEDDLRILNQRNEIQQLEIEQQALIRNLAIAGFVSVLLISTLIYHRIRTKRKFEQQELQRKREELEQARNVQLSLLPRKPMNDNGIEIRGKMITATEVGGDYYDYFRLDDHRVLIAFGDATGHGMTAGLIVTIAKVALINNLPRLANSNDLSSVVKSVNESILSTVTVKGIGLALQLFLLDSASKTLTFTSNGMPYPMVFDSVSQNLQTLEMHQPPLGFFKSIKADQQTIPWSHDQVLLLSSDGILERFNDHKEEYGFERLHDLLIQQLAQTRNLETLLDEVFRSTDQFANGIHHHDDMTVLGARVFPAG
jgi:serine phosphatase RsbU (regulator of sigma subunit)